MLEPLGLPPSLSPHICQRALDARDARFDGLFFVGIVTTRIYCRPTCPSRRADPDNRRFYDSAAAAERAGFRPCLRCRPELAPGRALMDAVSRLAYKAAQRIGAGALNGRSVAELAAELGVSERHLRRALRREIGVSPVELAQTHRLLLAKRLLADTGLPVTDVAFASGFESLRRFNVAFHERYGMSPSAVRRPAPVKPVRKVRGARSTEPARAEAPAGDLLRMTLAYRPPLAWDVLTGFLARRGDAGRRGRGGAPLRPHGAARRAERRGLVEDSPAEALVKVDLSPSLLPVLMPLLARLRQLFDLDAQPAVVDAHLERGGLAALVRRRRGVRLPGALDGFEVGLRTLLHGAAGGSRGARPASWRAGSRRAWGSRSSTGIPGARPAGAQRRSAWPRRERRVSWRSACRGGARRSSWPSRGRSPRERCGSDPGNDAAETQRALMEIAGIDERLATTIVMRALYWPDAFPASDRALQRAAGAASPRALRARAEKWRPWRAYAALHLWLAARRALRRAVAQSPQR